MNYYSTSDKTIKVSLKEAVFKGLARDGGLYMPEIIPRVNNSFIHSIEKLNFQQIAYELSTLLFGEDIPDSKLQEICYEAFNFDIPLVTISDSIQSLELFHGPTLAFKDIGARFMARMLAYLVQDNKDEINVLVATSGDTGSAVANGFLGVEGIKVHVLYPKGKVSKIQEMQFTTLGQNITAIEINGNFDDCQRLVKTAFNDKDLHQISLSSANSINLARLLPQSFYYWYAWKQTKSLQPATFCVPSGNFGNLTAGLIAKRMALPIKHFIAATNVNDIVPKYLSSGKYEPRASISTLANAMDVGNPSNFERMRDLYDSSQKEMAKDISAFAYTDTDIKETIRRVYKDNNYILDPHGAIGFMASEDYLKLRPAEQVIFLETAHPAKFSNTVNSAINREISLPDRLKQFLDKEKKSLNLGNDYSEFKNYLLNL